MKPKDLFVVIALLVITCLLAACGATTQAQPAAPTGQAAAPMPEVAIKLTDDGFTAPAQMPAGIVAVNSSNSSTKFQEGGMVLGKLNAGVTYDNIKALLASDDPDGYTKFDQMVTSLGGAERAIYNLVPGQYLAYFIGNIEGAPPISSLITVKDEGNTAAAPTAEITAEMKEFSFILPDEIKAGKHIWRINNTGQQAHHMLIVQLPKDVTADDIITWISAETPSGPPPFLNPDGPTVGAGFEVLSPGQSAWAEIDLPPGEYTAFCLLPDMSAQPPASHIAHGMHRVLKVVE